MQFSRKNHRTLQIGIHRKQGYFDFVWFDELEQPQCYQIFVNDKDFKNRFLQHLKIQFQGKTFPLQFVASISAHLTWSKVLMLPQILNAQECHQQCKFVIEKELPIPLDELWFDYISTPLKQGFCLEITAIREASARTYLQDFQPFRINVLDVVPHTILRAFQYLLNEQVRSENTLFLFQEDDYCLAICERSQQSQILQSHENLTVLYEQFTERFEGKIEQIFVYQIPSSHTGLLENWQRVETDLPFIALGNALWQKDLYQQKMGN
jgi:competence protein A